jgi:effector-binding domain-containing protein
MKILRRILLIILCIALVVVIIGFMLPRKIHVERRLFLNASQKTVFSQVNIVKNWINWSPWFQMDTAIRIVFSGPESGVGSSFGWMSNNKNVGNGRVSIISGFSSDSLVVLFDFAEKGKSTGKFTFLKQYPGTNCIWSLDSDLGLNPISRWFGLFSDRLIGPDMERGLKNLNEIVQNTNSVYGYEIVNYELPAQIMITVRDTASPETVMHKLSFMYKKLSLFLKSEDLSPIGNPSAIFHNYSNGNFDIEAGLQVPVLVSVPEGLSCSEKALQRTVMIKYVGSYKMISSAYRALQTYIYNNDLKMNGPGWEEYVTNPTVEADSVKRHTNIYYPVK